MTRRSNKSASLVHHMLSVVNGGTAVTTANFVADGQALASVNTANPGFPHAVKLRGAFCMNGCAAVNSAGDWTIHIRVNEAGTDSYSFDVPVPAGANKTVDIPDGIVLDPGDTYHVFMDGPSRNFLLARLVLEWEVL